jgi:hypothetical protein
LKLVAVFPDYPRRQFKGRFAGVADMIETALRVAGVENFRRFASGALGLDGDQTRHYAGIYGIRSFWNLSGSKEAPLLSSSRYWSITTFASSFP